MAENKLRPKQQRFVEEYLIDLNATQAVIRAGYKAKNADVTGAQLLGNLRIQAAIQELQVKRSERTEITQDWVLSTLKKNVTRAMQEEPVRDREGNNIGEYRWEGSVVNRGLELIGKHLGMFGGNDTITVGGLDDRLRQKFAELVTSRKAGDGTATGCGTATGEADSPDSPEAVFPA